MKKTYKVPEVDIEMVNASQHILMTMSSYEEKDIDQYGNMDFDDPFIWGEEIGKGGWGEA